MPQGARFVAQLYYELARFVLYRLKNFFTVYFNIFIKTNGLILLTLPHRARVHKKIIPINIHIFVSALQ